MMSKIYMEVTTDKYELPVAWAKSASELARITRRSKSTIESTLSKIRSGQLHRARYICVELEDDEEPE